MIRTTCYVRLGLALDHELHSMDADHFDALTRSLFTPSRRGLLGMTLAGVLVLLGLETAEAKNKKRKRKGKRKGKKKKKNEEQSEPCGSGNCPGCCAGGQCFAGDLLQSCGKGGENCQGCQPPSQTCRHQRCCGSELPPAAACASSGECCDGLTCLDSTCCRPPRSACPTQVCQPTGACNSCCNRNCTDGMCCNGPSQSCSADTDCCAGLECSDQGACCVQAGGPCQAGSECCNGQCTGAGMCLTECTNDWEKPCDGFPGCCIPYWRDCNIWCDDE